MFFHKIGSVDRIGELTGQMFRLRNLLCNSNVSLCILTFPLDHKPNINKAIFNIVLRGTNVIHSTNTKLIYFALKQNPCLVYDKNSFYPIWYDNDNIFKLFSKKYGSKEVNYPFSLTDNEKKIGNNLREKFGIPSSAEVVTLLVRESGYTSSSGAYGFRDANIENYIPAVNYLIEQGLYVVRIGDKSMKKIKNAPSQFIDAPFHPDYTDLVEPYFISTSKFFMGTGSGPMEIASGFDIPILATDMPLVTHMVLIDEKNIVIYKKLYSRMLKRNLTYEEILLSPCIDFFHDKRFEEADIEIVPNSSEEILLATKEMNERLDGKYSKSKIIEKINRQVRIIKEKALCFYKSKKYFKEYSGRIKITYYPYYCTFFSKCQISVEYTQLNPSFLGHDWPDSL